MLSSCNKVIIIIIIIIIIISSLVVWIKIRRELVPSLSSNVCDNW